MNSKKLISLLIVMLSFPLVYVLFSLTSWNTNLFVEKIESYFYLFFGGIIVFHWISLWIVSKLLKNENSSFKDIGYKLSKKGTIKLVLIYFLAAFAIYAGLEYFLSNSTVNQEEFNKLSAFFPKTSGQRLFFIFSVFSAGFCEEIIYRGYLITKLSQLGLNKWVSIIPAGVSFTYIHGAWAASNFWFYFIPAIFFSLIFLLSKRLLPAIIVHLVIDFYIILAVMKFVV